MVTSVTAGARERESRERERHRRRKEMRVRIGIDYWGGGCIVSLSYLIVCGLIRVCSYFFFFFVFRLSELGSPFCCL